LRGLIFLNKRKFEVIIHVTNEAACSRLKTSLEKVIVPKKFSLKINSLTDANKYAAYDKARRASDAKYKIYLDENIIITNENFLTELLEIFESDKKIGAVGTSGAIELSTRGVSFNSRKRGGKIFFGEQNDKLNDWKNFGEAQILDSFFFATQYDLPWHHDLFADNLFGMQAQCVEFKRAGYKVLIARQDKPWISYCGGNINLDEPSRQKFLDEYSADLFPLVSVIIPTFNRPKYFKEALDSALAQTYRNIEIFISDNSTDDATEILMQDYLARDKRIKYFRHKNFDADGNWNFARSYNNPDAEYVNWLMDDDLFYPTKIEKMLEVYRNNPDITLVTSARNFISAEGKIIKNTQNVFGKDIKLPGNEAGKLLFTYQNYIGEPTTVLIRKKFLRDNDLCYNAYETGFFSLVDVSTWLYLLRQGNMFRFIECLSALRTHRHQMTYSSKIYKCAPLDYATLLKQAWDEKFFLNNIADFKVGATNLLKESSKRVNDFYKAGVHDGDGIALLEKTTFALAQFLVNGYKLELPTP
ncbi:MAG: glycosyltransferase, partial [Selenomonadaceae bacterium]|nr:glycosyltransferase [Selenomonadaceae bacterium]